MTYLEDYQKHLKNRLGFFTIDPGARAGGGTGIARFYLDKKEVQFATQLKCSATEKNKIEFILEQIGCYFNDPKSILRLVFIEEPKYFDTYKGQTAASSGSLFKLIFFYGRLYQLLISLGYEVVPVKISHWKGQLSKEQVSKRVEKICGKKYKGDVCDAVGIGLYLLGKF